MAQKSHLMFLSCLLTLASFGASAQTPTTQVSTEYVMTYYTPFDAPHVVDSSLMIYNDPPGGWVKGPKINGTLIAPGGDWLRVMPAGNLRLDVRATIRTDDGAIIFLAYNGVLSASKESFDRFGKGELLTSKDLYFITTPTMQTSAEKYMWVNHTQFVGKVVEVKGGEGAYVKYDIFAVR